MSPRNATSRAQLYLGDAATQWMVTVLVVVLTVQLAAAADSPFRIRPTSVGRNLISGYGSGLPSATERHQHRRFSRIHADVLVRKLGDDFNSELMSVEKPSPNLTRTDGVVQSSYDADLYEALVRHVDFSVADEVTGNFRPMKPALRKYLEKWLLERASCRLRPAWTDLGPMYWPRWVRRGSCADQEIDAGSAAATGFRRKLTQRRRGGGRHQTEPSCSWPPGMRCVPEVSRTIRILRWHCGASLRRRRHHRVEGDRKPGSTGAPSTSMPARSKERRGRRGRARRPRLQEASPASKYGGDGRARSGLWQWRCRWKKVPYAVTTGCFCSC